MTIKELNKKRTLQGPFFGFLLRIYWQLKKDD